MKSDNLVLLPNTVYGTASGNYDGSSTTFSGNRTKGVTYYIRRRSVNTIRFICDEFVGTIKIEGSLDTAPNSDDEYFTMYTFPTDDSSSLDGSTAITTDFSLAITARVAWVRATVENFSGGTINSVTLTW